MLGHMTDGPDLDELLARLPQKAPAEVFAEIEAARRAAKGRRHSSCCPR